MFFTHQEAGIYQHAKIMLVHCLFLPKFAMRKSYNPNIEAEFILNRKHFFIACLFF